MATPPIVQTASPLWEDLRTDHAARTYRQLLKAEWPGMGVIGPPANFFAAGAGLSVNYAACDAIVHSADADNGAFYAHVEAGNVTLTAANGSNPRIDLIVLTLRNGTGDAVVDRVTGTPASSPVSPAVPAQSIPLCEVRVNAAATSPTSITARWWKACKLGQTILAYGDLLTFTAITGSAQIANVVFEVPPGKTCTQVEFDGHIPIVGANTLQDIGFYAAWQLNGVGTGLTRETYQRVFAANGLSGINNWASHIVARQWYQQLPPGRYTATLVIGVSTTSNAYDVIGGRYNIRVEYG